MTYAKSLSSAPTLSGEALWFLNGRCTIALSQTGNSEGLSVLDHLHPMGDAPPLHIHHTEDETFVILAGEVLFEVDGKRQTARAGDTLCAPRDVPHRFRVVSPEGARMLTITRGGFEAMVRSVSRPAAHAGLPEMMAPTPAMQDMLATACALHGISIIGAPLAA